MKEIGSYATPQKKANRIATFKNMIMKVLIKSKACMNKKLILNKHILLVEALQRWIIRQYSLE